MTVIQPLSAAAAYPLHRQRGLESSPADTGPASRLPQIWVRDQQTFTLMFSPAGKEELQINHIWILRSQSKRKAEIIQYPAGSSPPLTYCWYFCTIMHIVATACKYHFPPLASFASRSLLSSFLSPHQGTQIRMNHQPHACWWRGLGQDGCAWAVSGPMSTLGPNEPLSIPTQSVHFSWLLFPFYWKIISES